MKKNIFFCWMMLVALSSLFAKKSEFRLAIPNFPTKFTPYLSSETYTNLFVYNIFETLLDKQGDQYIPSVAKSWIHTSKNCTRFFIDENRYFHNGKKLTAYDVKASLEFVLDARNKIVRIDSLVVQSDYVLDVYSQQTDKMFERIDNVLIFESSSIQSANTALDFSLAIGSGSHYITEMSDDEIVFSKFLLHPKAEDLVDTIRILKVADKNVQTQMFMNGELDYLENPQPNYLKLYTPKHPYSTYKVFGHTVLFLTFDTQKETTNDGLPNPFTKKEVRRAMAQSFHLNAFLDQELLDYAMPLNTFISPIIREFPTIDPIPFQEQEAKNILEKHLSKDRVYKIDCIRDKFTGDLMVGSFIQRALKNMGFHFRINDVSTEELYRNIREENTVAYISGYSYDSTRIYPIFYYFFSKNQINNANKTFPFHDPFMQENLRLLQDAKNDSLRFQIETELMSHCMQTYKVIPLYSPHHIVLIDEDFVIENKKMLKFETLKLK